MVLRPSGRRPDQMREAVWHVGRAERRQPGVDSRRPIVTLNDNSELFGQNLARNSGQGEIEVLPSD